MAGVKGQVQRRGVERRRQIVAAAMELFGRQGSRATSIAAVAEAAGVTPGLVLHHFGSKDRLLFAVLRAREQEGTADVLPVVLDPGGLETLRRLVWFGEDHDDNPGYTAIYFTLEGEAIQPDTVSNEWFRDRLRLVRVGYADAIRRGQASGEIRPTVDADALAAEVFAHLDGTTLHWLIDPAGPTCRERYRTYLNEVLRRVATDPDVALIGPRRRRRPAT